jgi:hypothetical protein
MLVTEEWCLLGLMPYSWLIGMYYFRGRFASIFRVKDGSSSFLHNVAKRRDIPEERDFHIHSRENMYSLTVKPSETLLIFSPGHNWRVSQEVWAFLQTNVVVWNGAKVKPLSDIPYPRAFCPFVNVCWLDASNYPLYKECIDTELSL